MSSTRVMWVNRVMWLRTGKQRPWQEMKERTGMPVFQEKAEGKMRLSGWAKREWKQHFGMLLSALANICSWILLPPHTLICCWQKGMKRQIASRLPSSKTFVLVDLCVCSRQVPKQQVGTEAESIVCKKLVNCFKVHELKLALNHKHNPYMVGKKVVLHARVLERTRETDGDV